MELPKAGKVVIIRVLKREDLEPLFDLESDPEVKKYLSGPISKPKEEWIKGMQKRVGTFSTLVIESKQDGKFAGRASICRYLFVPDLSENDRELQIVIAERYWQHGFGREVCSILLDVAFTELGAERVFGVVDPRNSASLALLDSFSFKRIGIETRDGGQKDHLIFAITRLEYNQSLQDVGHVP
jgi:ribosomal-protein-alanine N-acetyltransferase